MTVHNDLFHLLCLLLDSLERHMPDHPDLVICHDDLSAAAQRYLKVNYNRVHLVDVTEHAFPTGPALLQKEQFTHSILYARLLIWTELFDAYDVVVYLDADTLVTGDLSPLFETKSFYMVDESYTGTQHFVYDAMDPEVQTLFRDDGIRALPGRSGNAGVFAVARAFRTRDDLAMLTSILRRYGKHLIWGDQSMFNLWMLQRDVAPSRDFRFNYQVRLLTQHRAADAYADARLVHFNGLQSTGLRVAVMQVAALLFSIPGVGRMAFATFYRAVREKRSVRTWLRRVWMHGGDRLFWRLRGANPRALNGISAEADYARSGR